jgi:hypothetical protein
MPIAEEQQPALAADDSQGMPCLVPQNLVYQMNIIN